jgi:hypothetical protein
MKRTPFALMLALALGFGTMSVMTVRADDTPAPTTKPARKPAVHGKISKVDGDKITVKPHNGDEVEVTTDSSTKFTLDGQPATIADAKEGLFIIATPDTGTAKNVRLSTKPPQRRQQPPADGNGNGNSK